MVSEIYVQVGQSVQSKDLLAKLRVQRSADRRVREFKSWSEDLETLR